MRAKDLTGKRFGRLTVLRKTEKRGLDGGIVYECVCDCGTHCLAPGSRLTAKGHSAKRSCGCLYRETHQQHGGSKTILFHKWASMKDRCYNKNAKQYKYYGGRGISVCEEWRSSFLAFREWSLKNGYNEGLSLDRIDPNKNYCPENCRWITMEDQQRNKRNVKIITYNGESHTIPEWSNILGIKYGTLWKRLHDGIPVEKAFKKGRL